MRVPRKKIQGMKTCVCVWSDKIPRHDYCLACLIGKEPEHFEQEDLLCCKAFSEATLKRCRRKGRIFRLKGLLPSSLECKRLMEEHPEWFEGELKVIQQQRLAPTDRGVASTPSRSIPAAAGGPDHGASASVAHDPEATDTHDRSQDARVYIPDRQGGLAQLSDLIPLTSGLDESKDSRDDADSEGEVSLDSSEPSQLSIEVEVPSDEEEEDITSAQPCKRRRQEDLEGDHPSMDQTAPPSLPLGYHIPKVPTGPTSLSRKPVLHHSPLRPRETLQQAAQRKEAEREEAQKQAAELQRKADASKRKLMDQAARAGSLTLSGADLVELFKTVTSSVEAAAKLAPQTVGDASSQIQNLVGTFVASPPEIPVPEFELLPPEGYELPGYGDGFAPPSLQGLWPESKSSCRPVMDGKPLASIKAEPSFQECNKTSIRLEGLAKSLREYMAEARGSSREGAPVPGVHWHPAAPPSELPSGLPSMEGQEVDMEEERFVPMGLPIPPNCREVLARVAYAPKIRFKSHFASCVRVPLEDYKTCLKWNTSFAPHEATPLVSATEGKDKAPEQLLQERVTKDPAVMEWHQALTQQIGMESASMKCHMANAAANQAAHWGAQRAEHCVGKAQGALEKLASLLVRNNLVDDSIFSDPAYQEVALCLRDASTHLRHVRNASSYIASVTEAGTDASARGIRASMEQMRSKTIASVLRLPTDKESAVQKVARELPVVPSSLFGGRWQTSLSLLGQRHQRRFQLQTLIKESTALESAPLRSTPSSRPGGSGGKRREPFPGSGGASAPPHKRKKRGGKGRATPKKQAQQKQQPAQSSTQPQARRGGPQQDHQRGKGKPRGKRGGRGGKRSQ